MFKKLLIVGLTVGLSGCNLFCTQHQEVKWAMVDMKQITTSTYESFKSKQPELEKFSTLEEYQQNSRNLHNQINQLSIKAKENCEKVAQADDQESLPELKTTGTNTIIYPSGEQVVLEFKEGGNIKIGGNEFAVDNKNFQECLAKEEKDLKIPALREELKKSHDLYRAKNQFDRDLEKKHETYVKEILKNYAEKKGYELILRNQYDPVLYSKDRIYLQITDDVIDYIHNKELINGGQ